MSIFTWSMAEEFRADGIAFNCLWPRTTIATSAIRNLLGGDELMKRSRKPEIMADAAHFIVTRPSRECTGRFFIDDEALKEAGVADLSGYSVVPGAELAPDFFVPTPGSKNLVGRA
jgi:citronellol/citronellal dehydrogenase